MTTSIGSPRSGAQCEAMKGWQATINRRRRLRKRAKFIAWCKREGFTLDQGLAELRRRLIDRRKAREAKREAEAQHRQQEDREVLLRQIDAGVYGKF